MKHSEIDSIVIHASATREGADFRAADLDRWHREQGYAMIGYHYVIDLDGRIEVGRPVTMAGAHCKDKGLSGRSYNQHSIGICYIGGLDKKGRPKDTRTREQKIVLEALVRSLMNRYPIVDVLGHRDASPDRNRDGKITPDEWVKDCPCFDVRSEFPIAICTAEKPR